MEPTIGKVNCVQDYLTWVNEVVDAVGNYAFRGQANSTWLLECGAARRLRNMAGGHTADELRLQEMFIQYHRNTLIRPARSYGFGSNEGSELGDLEILAKLQHLGAATCLLDFTRNSLIALWMACESRSKSEQARDGRVFAIDVSDRAKFRELTPSDARGTDNLGKMLRDSEGMRSGMSWYWEPPLVEDIAPRILRQHSLFVFSHSVLPEGVTESIAISSDKKQNIMETLASEHDLSRETLYRDIYGFAVANDQGSALKLPDTSVEYLHSSVESFAAGNFEAAIGELTEAVYLRPRRALLYFSRAHSKVALGQTRNDAQEYRAAIEDYDKAVNDFGQVLSVEERVVRAVSLYNRANARVALKDFEGALRDYTECIKLETNVSVVGCDSYFNRANVYFKMDRWESAAEDYGEAINRGQSIRHAYFNLANTYVRLEKYQESVEHYTKALDVDGEFEHGLRNRATTRALLGDLETAVREFDQHGAVGENRRLVAEALEGKQVTSTLIFVGNFGSRGNVGLAAFGGPEGGRGFSGDTEFAVPFRRP